MYLDLSRWSLSNIQALLLFMHLLLAHLMFENLTRRDLQISRSTEGAHYDVIARQLNIPTNKLKSLSISPSSHLSCKLSERNVLTSPSLLFDREELQILVDNGLIYTTINDDYYKSTVNAWWNPVCFADGHAALDIHLSINQLMFEKSSTPFVQGLFFYEMK